MTKDTLPSPVSVPEGDAREIARRIVAGQTKSLISSPEALEAEITAALLSAESRGRAAEAERDTATRALAVLDKIAWLAAEEDSWFGDETDITVQRAAAERHRAALSKTEGKG